MHIRQDDFFSSNDGSTEGPTKMPNKKHKQVKPKSVLPGFAMHMLKSNIDTSGGTLKTIGKYWIPLVIILALGFALIYGIGAEIYYVCKFMRFLFESLVNLVNNQTK